MKKILILMMFALAACSGQENEQPAQTENASSDSAAMSDEVARWESQAQNITIIRDQWGVPHIYGKTDADTVFGVMYAQAEDDFNRVEVNYMNAMGLLAQAEGEGEIFRDLRMRLFIQPDEMKRLYEESPDWLKELMNAYADGLNYYLYKNPDVQPKVIKKFEPWMALSFSEGSIGGDIERAVRVSDLEQFYGGTQTMAAAPDRVDWEPRGSNGMAIAPAKTKNGKALLYINPHTTHYFREEAHMVSEEGLNAYGALTWGQFFIYQGFSEYNGWMHTSTYSDVYDEFYYNEIIERDGKLYYMYGDEEREVTQSVETIEYKTDNGMASRDFTIYHTHHGPIVREEDGKWIAVQMMNIPLTALTQSYTRAKTKSYDEFYEMMRLKSNSSNNTVYADKDGNIAYFHGNFHPIRNTDYDFNHPVDGGNPDTDWKGLHPVEDAINLLNPGSGWLYNTNNWPFSAAGPDHSPKKEDYPSYMSVNWENPRGEHALQLYPGINDFDIDTLIEAGYDGLLPAFERFVPVLKAAYDANPDENLKEAVDMLVAWDKRTSMTSVETSLAHHWGNELWKLPPRGRAVNPYDVYEYVETQLTAEQYLSTLKDAMARMEADFGTWQIAWGEINRFQRNDSNIRQTFDDSKPSYPMELASGRWGALASIGTRQHPGTKKWYGTSGNSFIASVEFGDKVKAKALMAGGLNSDPDSPYFFNQGEMYGRGEFRDVNYYREDVEKNAERTYHPGE